MKKEFVMSLSQSYRQDLLNATQLAEQGMLSPSQQAYCFEEIEDTKGTAFYPAHGDELFRKLRTALGEKAQISERQRAETELHKLGVELLFHIYINRFTFAEITHNTAAHKYDAIIYLMSVPPTRISAPTPQRCARRLMRGWRKTVLRQIPPP